MNAQLKVLVVDDEVLIADTLGIILRQGGYQCRVVYSGTDALQELLSFRPELLISDVIMPGLRGIDLAIRARELLPGCEILLLSGQAATADLMQVASAAGHSFDLLSKPVHPDELLNQVARRIKRVPSSGA
ncbi:MAG: response regulator [Acidobacteriota bacterium]